MIAGVNNSIQLLSAKNPACFSDFLRVIQAGLARRQTTFSIEGSAVDRAFANAIVPMTAAIEHYRDSGIAFSFSNIPDYLVKTRFGLPLLVAEEPTKAADFPLDRIWRFGSFEEVTILVDATVREVSKGQVCAAGILEAVEWCLNEIMDNVLQHSQSTKGYMMAQHHKASGHLSICIVDTGIGIFNSLKGTHHAPRNPSDAITLAIKEGVTRDKAIGQGNGMWGLHQILHENQGTLNIVSNSASYFFRETRATVFHNLPTLSQTNGMCIVDFQIDANRETSISRALGGQGSTSIVMESALLENGSECRYSIRDRCHGTGTRKSAERTRNEIINIYKANRTPIVVDFGSTAIISSSFADELIGKLVIEFGFVNFNSVIRLSNMNPTVQAIVHRSVAQRMAEHLGH